MKIDRKIKKAKKKMRKQYKKDKELGKVPIRRKKRQDKIPNSYPFKA